MAILGLNMCKLNKQPLIIAVTDSDVYFTDMLQCGYE